MIGALREVILGTCRQAYQVADVPSSELIVSIIRIFRQYCDGLVPLLTFGSQGWGHQSRSLLCAPFWSNRTSCVKQSQSECFRKHLHCLCFCRFQGEACIPISPKRLQGGRDPYSAPAEHAFPSVTHPTKVAEGGRDR